MSKDLCPEKAYIFRIIHRDNLDSVMANGCLSRSAVAKKAGYVEIGNLELIDKRTSREVPCSPFGTLSDYVPFYFTPFSPMLYNIKTGYTVPKRPMSEILILVSSLHKLKKNGVPFVFSDRHAYLRTAQFSSDLSDLDRIIWDVLQKRDFTKNDIDRFEKYQAEALVHMHLPLNQFSEIVCYNEDAKAIVQEKASQHGEDMKVIAKSEWFL